MENPSILVLSVLCGVFAAVAAFLKAINLTRSSYYSKFSAYSFTIGLLALGFSFLTLVFFLWWSTADPVRLAEQKSGWAWAPKMIWWIQLICFGGLCLFVFFNYETGPFSLTWKHSSSIAFALGLGQVGFFVYGTKILTKSLQTRES